MRKLPILVVASTLAWMYANQAKALNMITPKKGFICHKDIAYGQKARQLLDIYLPDKPSNKKSPVVLFVHGGTWKHGRKEDYLFLGESLAKEGMVTLVINYHLAPKHIYPSFVYDTAEALKWTMDNIESYLKNLGHDAGDIFVMGHSAGAFNVVAALNSAPYQNQLSFLAQVGLLKEDVRARVKGVIGIAGPYSYDFTTDKTVDVFPLDKTADDIMPNRRVGELPLPHLLLTAQTDNTVDTYNTLDMFNALKEKGAKVTHVTVKNTNHVSIMGAFASRLAFFARTKEVVLDFITG